MVTPLRVLVDNYAWVFPSNPGCAAVVDPGEAEPVLAHLQAAKLRLTHILLTHHHQDHVGGVEELRRRFEGVQVVGSQKDAHRLPTLNQGVVDREQIQVGIRPISVLEVPGHTSGHVAYLLGDALFSGDTLFSFGCGRLFEGTPAEMWATLKKFRALPASTMLYSAHEYTVSNLRFALELEPENTPLLEKLEESLLRRERQQPTLPSPMQVEKRLNPFLRCDNAHFIRHLGLEGKTPEEVFANLRNRRNLFTDQATPPTPEE